MSICELLLYCFTSQANSGLNVVVVVDRGPKVSIPYVCKIEELVNEG